MENYLRWIVVLNLACLSACSPVNSLTPFDQKQAALVIQQNYTPRPAKQRISIALPKHTHWQRIDLSRGTLGTPIMLVPPGQNADDWHESIITGIRPYIFHTDMTADKFMRKQIRLAKKNCKQVRVQIAASNAQTAIFALKLADCTYANQTQITKALTGIDAVYTVRYAVVENAVTQTTFDNMAAAIKTATLIRDTRTISMPPSKKTTVYLSFLIMSSSRLMENVSRVLIMTIMANKPTV